MQDKNKANVSERIDAVAKILNAKDYRALAKLLNVSEAALYSWIKRGKIGNTGKILANVPTLSLDWLETGEGEMFKYTPPSGDNISFNFGKPAELLQTPNTKAHVDLEVSAGTSNASQAADGALSSDTSDDEEIPIEDMVLMTREVLASRTVYRSALASNVRAFHQAVKKEEQMKTTNEKLDAMTAEMAEMKAMLKELLNPGQKRDQKAG